MMEEEETDPNNTELHSKSKQIGLKRLFFFEITAITKQMGKSGYILLRLRAIRRLLFSARL